MWGQRSWGTQDLAGREGGQVDPHKPPGKLAVSTPTEHFPTHKPAAQEPASYESKDAHAFDQGTPSADKTLCGWPPQRLFTAAPPSRNNPTPQRTATWNVFVQGSNTAIKRHTLLIRKQDEPHKCTVNSKLQKPDPKTTPWRVLLRQVQPPSGGRGQRSHCPGELLGARKGATC